MRQRFRSRHWEAWRPLQLLQTLTNVLPLRMRRRPLSAPPCRRPPLPLYNALLRLLL